MPSNADKVTSSSLSASSPVALLLINQSRTFPSSVISPENAKEIINWICVLCLVHLLSQKSKFGWSILKSFKHAQFFMYTQNHFGKVQSADVTCDVIKKVAPRTDVLNLQTE